MSAGLDTTVAGDAPTLADRLRGPRRAGISPGTVLGERYEITRCLGRGGMGTVYAARDRTLERNVALKVLHATTEPQVLIDEARSLARLSDPHVVQVYDAAELDGTVVIAMQLVDGDDLAAALERKPTVPQIIAWFYDAGRGLAAAHDSGLVHRDFKPSNVLIDRRGHALVTDFGLALATDGAHGSAPIGVLMGTPGYMAPEQHALGPATTASDQFSFCVSLWEALFGEHPYIVGDRGAISPFEIGEQMFEASLRRPSGRRVPRRVVDALARGLEREPELRWPSMHTLVAELAPARKRSVWSIAIASGFAAVAAGTIVWLALDRHTVDDTCKASAERRLAEVWSPASARSMREHFTRSGRSYAARAADHGTTAIEAYTGRWKLLASDVCVAEHTGAAAAVASRRACVDGRLEALRGVGDLLATAETGDVVDHVQDVVDGLPDLGDCSDAALPAAPPLERRASIAKVESDLARAEARTRAGELAGAIPELRTLVSRAEALAWPPLEARAYLGLGEAELSVLAPGARDDLMKAADLATRERLDRDAVRAESLALRAAGIDAEADAVAVLAPVTHATAARTGDRALAVLAEISHGRALVQLHHWKDGLDRCKAALADARTYGRVWDVDEAYDCMLEALVPLGLTSEADHLIADRIAEKTRLLGPDHPNIADYLVVRAQQELRHGDISGARADLERALVIRKATFPPEHLKRAEVLMGLAELADTEGKRADAKPMYEEALRIANAASPQPTVMITQLHVALATIEQLEGDTASVRRHYEEAIALARSRWGNDSIELASLLVNDGQIVAMDDYATGLAMLDQAQSILERHHDKRTVSVIGAIALIELKQGHAHEALARGQQAIGMLDADTPPPHVAMVKFIVARAMRELHESAADARALAVEARDGYAKLGPAYAARVQDIDDWLKAR